MQSNFLEIVESQIECRKRKRNTPGCMEYELFELENNWDLLEDFRSDSYEILPSDAFIVEYPTAREVFAGQYRDRVVHHLIIRRTMHKFEENFIHSSYSCRIGKGTLFGIDDAYNQLYKATSGFKKEIFVIKGDLTSCFMRVNKQLMMSMVREKITQDPFELWLFEKIIFNKPQDYCILKTPHKRWADFPEHKSLFGTDGMPIGNLTSQILVNFYLSPFDHWAMKYTDCLGFGRYVDDFFAYFETRKQAERFIKDAGAFLKDYNMELHPKKIRIISSTKGFEFIGAYIKPNRIYPTKRTILKFVKTLYGSQTSSMCDWFAKINSHLGYLNHFRSYRYRAKILHHFKHLSKFGYLNGKLTKFTPFKDYQHLIGCKRSKMSKSECQELQYHNELWNRISKFAIKTKLLLK